MDQGNEASRQIENFNKDYETLVTKLLTPNVNFNDVNDEVRRLINGIDLTITEENEKNSLSVEQKQTLVQIGYRCITTIANIYRVADLALLVEDLSLEPNSILKKINLSQHEWGDLLRMIALDKSAQVEEQMKKTLVSSGVVTE